MKLVFWYVNENNETTEHETRLGGQDERRDGKTESVLVVPFGTRRHAVETLRRIADEIERG